MNNTYCGNDCEKCTYRDRLNCKGCAEGPGKAIGGDCNIASCCREKYQEHCGNCPNHENCLTLKGRASNPEYRLKMAAPTTETLSRFRNAKNLQGDVNTIFWLTVVLYLIDIITELAFFSGTSVLPMTCSVIYGAFLINMNKHNDHFKYAGIFYFLYLGATILTKFITGILVAFTPLLFICLSTHQKCAAFSETLYGYDSLLSERWLALRKWFFISLVGVIISAVLLFGNANLAAVILIIFLLVFIGVLVFELIYIRCTWRIFRDYQPTAE